MFTPHILPCVTMTHLLGPDKLALTLASLPELKPVDFQLLQTV
jgi:hypothetical protein